MREFYPSKRGWSETLVTHRSDIGVCRRRCDLPANSVGQGIARLVVSELASNLYKYARGGRLLQGAGWSSDSWVAVSLDEGPGLGSEPVFQDGFSKGGSIGSGLGTVRRMSTRFTVSGTERTRILSQVGGDVNEPIVVDLSGSPSVNGDVWRARHIGDRLRLALFDGGGSGAFAREAALRAVDTVFGGEPRRSLEAVMSDVHRRCRDGRRGVVGMVVDVRPRSVRWVGAGDARLWSYGPSGCEPLALTPGRLGREVGALKARTLGLPTDGALMLCTDGMGTPSGGAWQEGLLTALEGRGRRRDAMMIALPAAYVTRIQRASSRVV